MHFSWWKWSIDSRDRMRSFFCVSAGPLRAAPGRSGLLRDGLGRSGPAPAGHSAHKTPLPFTNFPSYPNFAHRIPLPCTNFHPHINFVHQMTLSCTYFTPYHNSAHRIPLSCTNFHPHINFVHRMTLSCTNIPLSYSSDCLKMIAIIFPPICAYKMKSSSKSVSPQDALYGHVEVGSGDS